MIHYDTSCKVRVTSCKLRVASCKLQINVLVDTLILRVGPLNLTVKTTKSQVDLPYELEHK